MSEAIVATENIGIGHVGSIEAIAALESGLDDQERVISLWLGGYFRDHNVIDAGPEMVAYRGGQSVGIDTATIAAADPERLSVYGRYRKAVVATAIYNLGVIGRHIEGIEENLAERVIWLHHQSQRDNMMEVLTTMGQSEAAAQIRTNSFFPIYWNVLGQHHGQSPERSVVDRIVAEVVEEGQDEEIFIETRIVERNGETTERHIYMTRGQMVQGAVKGLIDFINTSKSAVFDSKAGPWAGSDGAWARAFSGAEWDSPDRAFVQRFSSAVLSIGAEISDQSVQVQPAAHAEDASTGSEQLVTHKE